MYKHLSLIKLITVPSLHYINFYFKFIEIVSIFFFRFFILLTFNFTTRSASFNIFTFIRVVWLHWLTTVCNIFTSRYSWDSTTLHTFIRLRWYHQKERHKCLSIQISFIFQFQHYVLVNLLTVKMIVEEETFNCIYLEEWQIYWYNIEFRKRNNLFYECIFCIKDILIWYSFIYLSYKNVRPLFRCCFFENKLQHSTLNVELVLSSIYFIVITMIIVHYVFIP